MAYSYDEMQGEVQPAHLGSQSQTGTQVAGDVVDMSQEFRREQIFNAARQKVDKALQIPEGSFKAKVLPIKPDK